MRLTREQLTYKALCVAHDAMRQAQAGPVAPTPGLRFALAYLYQVSDGDLAFRPDYRSAIDEFWNVVRSVGREGDKRANENRAMYAHSSLLQICRQVRMPHAIGLIEQAHPPARKEPPALDDLSRTLFREGLRRAGMISAREKDDKRRFYWRPPRPGER